MKTRIHAIAGGIGFLMILLFWTSTLMTELFAGHETIAATKAMILRGMWILIPAMAIVGASGMAMGRKRTDSLAMAKKKRMPLIAANGILILVPCAFFLAGRAAAGQFDGLFYAVQGLELVAGAANLTMMGLNIRDGLKMTGKIGSDSIAAATPSAQNRSPVIEERPAGPLVAKAIPRLTGSDGEFETQPVMALCRCGASKNKPFCDGTHNDIGFTSDPAPDRTVDKVRIYEGRDINIHYNRLLCSHAAECGARLKPVFDSSRKPWIEPKNATPEEIKEVIRTCPSGALSFSEPGVNAQHLVNHDAGITIEPNGPYRVSEVPLASGVHAEGASPDKYVLCRCGASKNKPFCDGTHADIGWTDKS